MEIFQKTPFDFKIGEVNEIKQILTVPIISFVGRLLSRPEYHKQAGWT